MRFAPLSFALVLSAVSAFGADRWTKFEDPSGNFTVEFPGLPRARTGDVGRTPGIVGMYAYYIESAAGSLTVFDNLYSSRGTPSDQVSSSDRVIDMLVKNIVIEAAGSGGKLQSDMPDTLDGQTGRRISVLQSTGGIHTYRLFYVAGHAITAAVAVPPGARPAQTADANRFLTSLHLTPQRPN